jgi:hypothetical protein
MELKAERARFQTREMLTVRSNKTFLASLILVIALQSAFARAEAGIPNWIKLTVGASGYFGVGFPGRPPACRTFEKYVAWLESSYPEKGQVCPTVRGGERVTILGWRLHSSGAGMSVPVVHVQFDHSVQSVWSSFVSPVVPVGAMVVITGVTCSQEAYRVHANMSSAAQLLSACTAVVLSQQISSVANTLLIRFRGSGRTIKTSAVTAFVPGLLYPNGYPRYSLSRFTTGS